ncbi:galactonate dehydratase [Parasphingorhabdus litoris]|uniref:Galactonate dehydratase n=1 Tax=Parasphingorhabdus litoris TaxID=394733 RepID=A0ABN1ATJ6_9SPHN|nr:mandelate racemase/muconate lactonizing enzyme family protein [Parasphingorhabdus litoris]
MIFDRRQILGAGATAAAIGMMGAAGPAWAVANTGRARIAEVDAYIVHKGVFVKVTADDGTTGWGEAGHNGRPLVKTMVDTVLDRLCKGKDVFDINGVWSAMYYEADELGPGGIASQAIAGIDCALWDLRGKLLNQPVWALLGGKLRDEFPLYGSFSRNAGSGKYHSPKKCAEIAASLVDEGFNALKVRLSIREENADPDPDPARSVISEVRRAVGDNIDLYVDANNGYRAARAIQIGKMLSEEFGVSVFEEPVAAYHYASMWQVSDALDMHVSAGEHEYSKWMFRDLIERGKPDLINPDASKASGLTEMMKIATMAEVRDLPISVHNARPTLLNSAHAHFIAAAPTATRPQEHPGLRRLNKQWEYFENHLKPVNGRMNVPDEPGLGLVVDEKRIAQG